MFLKQILIIVFISNTIYSQNRILDKSNLEPLSFVNIYEKNNKIGFYSNTDGYFEIPHTLIQSDTLIFSALGYKSIEITIK
ncbi:carboxypeptidase-like regulatory domain-containing protein [Tenacibaculum haliotis]|uniref:carboxypeptidase-like regulatory domain-containing protein n=1 Tax=Tenacibaculum haliotis TaxID=1888914 RepID=UPI0021B0828B|nr:carboxypeptidase-like regulatory domain-containing protein [Tenacibaculum haliotis]MCT4698490.1 carboxypeptidase-like regulatory domain-containing protein [Tenacibaculum haliotis]